MTKLIAFDLDGTLINTLTDLTTALNHALNDCGYPSLSQQRVAAIVGHSVVYMCKEAVPPEHSEDWKRVLDGYMDYYARHNCDASRPYEGIPQVLSHLKSAGLKLAVVSNKPHKDSVQIISRLFPRDTFNMVVGRLEKFSIKPAPDALQFVLDTLGVRQEDAIYVGDSDVDVAFARNAGVPCVSVSWGYRSREELLSAGATRIVDDSNALEAALLPSRSRLEGRDGGKIQ